MARIGGRNSWIAVPAGVVCAAIVGALLWLALPMLPVTITWMGDTLRRATTAAPAADPEPSIAQQAADGGAVDCRSIYPDDLWNELMWRAGSFLDQTTAAPATAATSFAEAAAPQVVVTCEWRFASGGIATTLSRVAPDTAAIAEAALAGDGFACRSEDTAVLCSRTQGAVLEEHAFRDGLWLASVETDWHPEDYGSRIDRVVWG